MPTEKTDSSVTPVTESFLNTSSTITDSTNPYGDFFQETSDGNISIGTKVKKSDLEVATGILSYVVPILIVIGVIASVHVVIRTQDNSSFAENYPFLCPYLNMGINTEDKGCKTLKMIESDYGERRMRLEEQIVTGLTEYIPIKITQNAIDASPERGFIEKAFVNKVKIDEIIKQFEEIRNLASFGTTRNIECNGISITGGDTLSTQCTIFGGKIGEDGSNNRLASARIEALSFLERLGNTASSKFILLNPPSALTVETLRAGEEVSNIQFETRTTVQIQVRYVPLPKKS